MRVEKEATTPTPVPPVSPQPIAKMVVLGVLVVAGTALFMLMWSRLLQRGIDIAHVSGLLMFIGTILAACLMAALVAVSSLVMSRAIIVLGMFSVAALTLFAFFRVSVWSCIAALLLIGGFYYSYREISADAKSRIKVMAIRMVSSGARTTISIVILAVSFLYYSNVVSGPDATARFSASLVSSGSKAVDRVLKLYYKDKYDPAMTLDAFIAQISNVAGDLKFSTGQKVIDQAISEGFSQAQHELIIQAREDFLKTMGIQASGDEPMQSVVEKIVRRNLDKYVGTYMQFIPAILALGLFLLLNAFNFVFGGLIKLMSFVIFHVLKGLRFITIQKTMVEAERISL